MKNLVKYTFIILLLSAAGTFARPAFAAVVSLGESQIVAPGPGQCGTDDFEYQIYLDIENPALDPPLNGNIASVDIVDDQSNIISVPLSQVSNQCGTVSGSTLDCIRIMGSLSRTSANPQPGDTFTAGISSAVVSFISGPSLVTNVNVNISNTCTIPTSGAVYPTCVDIYNNCMTECTDLGTSDTECTTFCTTCGTAGQQGNCCTALICDGTGMCVAPGDTTGRTRPDDECDYNENVYNDATGYCESNPACTGTSECCIQHGSGAFVCRPMWQQLGYTNYEQFGEYDAFIRTVSRLLTFVGIAIGVVLIVSCGYKFMTSQGDPRQLQDAKECLTSAIIGLLFILLSVSILRVLINSLLR